MLLLYDEKLSFHICSRVTRTHFASNTTYSVTSTAKFITLNESDKFQCFDKKNCE